MFSALALVTLLVEAAAGYPDWLFRRVGHPVTWIGAIIRVCDDAFNTSAMSDAKRRLMGVVTLAIIVGASVAVGLIITAAVFSLFGPFGSVLILGVIASALVAQRSLHTHVAAVADALDDGGIEAGRMAVSHIVGRDPGSLDTAGVSRAAIESLAENFSDGVVAPLFWLAVAGLPGILVYKAVNTADSMIGHLTPRHRAFGWAAAKTDDLVNLPASRLTALLLVLASFLVRANAKQSYLAIRRDARKHRSPNAGWPEAAVAGALELRLAGPRSYDGETIQDHWMGDGRADATSSDIRHALSLYRAACAILAVVFVLLTAVWL